MVVILLVFLDVSWKEGVLTMQILMHRVRHLILVVFLDYWLLWRVLLISKHRKVVRISTTRMAIRRRNVN